MNLEKEHLVLNGNVTVTGTRTVTWERTKLIVVSEISLWYLFRLKDHNPKLGNTSYVRIRNNQYKSKNGAMVIVTVLTVRMKNTAIDTGGRVIYLFY